MKLISKIILKLISGNLFQDNSKDTYLTPFNWFFFDKMPELLDFFDHITKVSLPNFIDKLVNNKLVTNYKFDYFKENLDEIVTHISICYNVNNLILI